MRKNLCFGDGEGPWSVSVNSGGCSQKPEFLGEALDTFSLTFPLEMFPWKCFPLYLRI